MNHNIITVIRNILYVMFIISKDSHHLNHIERKIKKKSNDAYVMEQEGKKGKKSRNIFLWVACLICACAVCSLTHVCFDTKMAASLPFVGTIDSDEEIEPLDEDNDSEEEEQVRTLTL